MTSKTAYLWGPISSFSGPLAAWLLTKGWHVHIATKSALHVALSPLDLRSAAQNKLEAALGGIDGYKTFQDRLKYLDVGEVSKGTTYDAIIFCGLPPNFDEPRVSRAPWAAEQLTHITRRFKGVPTFIVSSLWGAVQADGVVPEELECERRKALSPYEAVAQQYENKIQKCLGQQDAHWYLVRLPMIWGSTVDGKMINFSGPMTLLEKLVTSTEQPHKEKQKALALHYNPDGTLWFLPVDVAVYLFWRLLEDETRPRICNLVSTQATLNREWLQDVAKVLGLKKAAAIEGDPFNLPNFLKKALGDNVLVKTRGLFEVMGRYQQPPTVIDVHYFDRVLDFGRQENWGKLAQSNGVAPLEFSEQLANSYFKEFLPENASSDELKQLTGESGSVEFRIDGVDKLAWVMRPENGRSVVESSQDGQHPANIRFCFSSKGMVELIQRKVSLERALVLRDAKVEGKPMDIIKACNWFKRFVKDHPYKPAVDTHASGRQLTKSAKK